MQRKKEIRGFIYKSIQSFIRLTSSFPPHPPTIGQGHKATPMRLLSHNVLRNTATGVIEGFPLKIEVTRLEVREAG